MHALTKSLLLFAQHPLKSFFRSKCNPPSFSLLYSNLFTLSQAPAPALPDESLPTTERALDTYEDSYLQSIYNGALIDRNPSRVISTFNNMTKNGVAPNTATYNAVIKAHLRQNNIKSAYDYLLHMEDCGVQPDKQTFLLLIEEMAKAPALSRIAQNLIHLATSPKYRFEWDADFAMWDAICVSRKRDSAAFLDAYRRIYAVLPAKTTAIPVAATERLFVAASADRSLHAAFLTIWGDACRENLPISLRTTFALLFQLANTMFEDAGFVADLFAGVKRLEVDDGLLQLLLVFAIRKSHKPLGECVLLKMHRNLQATSPENSLPPWIVKSVMNLPR